MKHFVVVLLLALAVCTSAKGAETFKIDPAHSTIAFKVRHMLGSAKGKFSRFSGTIVVDRDNPEQSSVTVRIQAASIDTGIAKRDDHLRAELFEVAKHPEITFVSRRVKRTGASSGEIIGDLTMHGVTRSIILTVQLVGDRWQATTAPLKRSQFGLVFSKSAETISMISDEVVIEIGIAAKRAE